MAAKSGIQYDSDAVFISYSPEDIDWAEDELRPRLEKSGVKVITGEDLTGGATVSLNRERAIADTQRTIVVLSPEWVANSWNGFEADMLVHLDPAAIKRKLLPVLLRKTEIPPRIARLTIRDLTDKKRYESRLAQLIRDVEDAVIIPPRETFPNPWEWYWRQARRRGATPGRVVVLSLVLLLVLLMVGQIWPFQPREMWTSQSISFRGAARLHNAGAVLIVGGENSDEGCLQGQTGLWYRKLGITGTDADWYVSRMIPPDLLCSSKDRGLAGITSIASHPDVPDVVYALTDVAGLLVSRDAGVSFSRYHKELPRMRPDNLPWRLVVGGTPTAPILWMAGDREGLWRLDQSG
ncbi:MAG: TIR domain-containing protein [Caldilineaceae bacterium]|nr:TIR domain-containing protein [Caldilineaceae bacterium]